MFSIQFRNSRNFQMSELSSITAVVEFGMVLPHFVREPAICWEWLLRNAHADRLLFHVLHRTLGAAVAAAWYRQYLSVMTK